MKTRWLAMAIVSMAALPAFAQDSTTMTTTTTTSAPGMMPGEWTTVDSTRVHDYLASLRGYLNRIHDNNMLAVSSADIVQADGYNRSSTILLENATSLAINALDALGSPLTVPPGWGATRAYTAMVEEHLAHARLLHDYTSPVAEAKDALDHALQEADVSAAGMTGSYHAGMRSTETTPAETTTPSVTPESPSTTPETTTPSTTPETTTPSVTPETTTPSTTPDTTTPAPDTSMPGMGTMGTPNTTNPSTNQSNPALNNSAPGTNQGMGDTTTVPNTTPGTTDSSGTTATPDTSAGTSSGTSTDNSGSPSQ